MLPAPGVVSVTVLWVSELVLRLYVREGCTDAAIADSRPGSDVVSGLNFCSCAFFPESELGGCNSSETSCGVVDS